jgi:Mg2+/citrate symporter
LYQFKRRAIKLTSYYRGTSLLSTSYKILSNFLPSRLSPYVDEIIGIISVGIDVTDQLQIRSFCILQILEKKMREQSDSTSAIRLIQLGGKYCTISSYGFGFP